MNKPIIPLNKEEDERDCPLKIGDRVRAVFYSSCPVYYGKLIGFKTSYGVRYAKVRYDGHGYTTLVNSRYLFRA